MVAITPQGVTGTTLNEYREILRQRLLDIDPSWNLENESPDGQMLAIWSEALALLDEEIQYAYMSVDPDTAIGQGLDRIAEYAEIRRKEATFSTSTVTLGGVNGTLIPAGSEVRNKVTGTIWDTQSDQTIPGDVLVICETPGQEFASVGDLSEIATPIAGWQTVTNANAATLGRNRESDDVFRLSRTEAVGLPGSNQVDNISAAVSQVDGVNQSIVYENSRKVVDSRGLDPSSICIIVDGGDNAEIRSAIASKKNPGCNMNQDAGFPNQNTAQSVTPRGNPVDITFFRPDVVTAYIDVTIVTETMTDADKEDIKANIVKYSQRGVDGVTGFDDTGFRIGERITAGKIYTPVNQIVGDRGYTESIVVGSSPSPSGQSIPIAFNQLGAFDVANINVEYLLP